MIKGDEFQEIVMLGRLQAVRRALDEIALPAGEAAEHLEKARIHLLKAQNRHWDFLEKYVSEDNT